jgi:glycosyltransferase involved in cell wall biosynthesis
MKIARIVDSYSYPSVIGPNVFINVLSTELAKRGHECIIYSFVMSAEPPLIETVNGYSVKYYKPLFRFWTFPISFKIIRDIIEDKPDIIHVHGYRSFHSELAAWLDKVKRIPYVLNPHGSLLGYRFLATTKLSKSLYPLYDALTLKHALRRASCIAVTSNQEAREALEIGIPQDKIRIMPHAEDLYGISPPEPSISPNHIILTVGRINPQQNWDTLIKAFVLVLKHIPDAKLVIVGPPGHSLLSHTYTSIKRDYSQRLQELCSDLNISDKVIFRGLLVGEELKKTYISCGIFTYTAPYGNYGRTHIEAATFGKPIISTPVGIVPDLVGKDEGGFLVAPYDTEGIAQAMVSLLSNTDLYRAKQKSILERVKKFLDVKRMVDAYEELYQEITRL